MNGSNADHDFPPPQFLLDARSSLEELRLFVDGAMFGFLFVSRYSDLVPVLAPATVEHHKKIYPQMRELQQYAKQQFDSPLVYEIACVRQVTALEAAVADACLQALRADKALYQRPAIRDLRGPIIDFALASDSERAEYIVDCLAQDKKIRLKPGVGKFEPILECVGLGGGLADEVRRVILELTTVRNVIVHRKGRLDAQALMGCPWLGEAGTKLAVTHKMMTRYTVALDYYLAELTRRWVVAFAGPEETRRLAESRRDAALAELRDLL